MTATAHAVLGTVIAAKIGNPAIAIPIALASHIVADAIPHWDVGTHEKTKKWKDLFMGSFFDVLFGFILSYLLLVLLFPQTNLVYALAIIFVSQLFDWLTAPYYFFHIGGPFKLIYKFQKLFDHKLDKPWGVITQVAVLLVVIIFAKSF